LNLIIRITGYSGRSLYQAKEIQCSSGSLSKDGTDQPLDHEAWLACAQLLFSRRKINEAIEFLGLSYKHINNNPTLHFRLAAYYTYSKNFTEAGKHFEKGLSLNYQEYKEMFRQFPKTKGYSFFYNIIEKHIGADHKYYTI
jgi:tetratricopeptide (TPR) repeat protein